MNKINKIEIFLFGKKLSTRSNILILFYTLGSIGWFPSVEGLLFVKNLWDYVIFAIIYVGILVPLYIIIGRIIAPKQEKISVLEMSICVLLMTIQSGIMLYMYSYQILHSNNSLWITIPSSLIVTFIGVTWTRFYKDDK
jgi:hypothetical protein